MRLLANNEVKTAMSYLKGLSRQTNVCEAKLKLTCIYNPNVASSLFSALEIPVIILRLLLILRS